MLLVHTHMLDLNVAAAGPFLMSAFCFCFVKSGPQSASLSEDTLRSGHVLCQCRCSLFFC